MIRDRTLDGFVWGIAATLAMSVLMVAGTVTGMSPIPEPIPKAIVLTIVGSSLPPLVLMGLSVGAHLTYGGLFGAALGTAVDEPGVVGGVALGIGLWAILGVVFLPLVGWGLFGTGVTPRIAVATLVLHLIYGVVLGVGLDRTELGTTTGAATA